MLKWDVGRSPAFNVHSLCLYFLKCTLQSAFGVSSSLCRCGPFGNVLVRHFCVRACVRAISCVQQVVGLWRTWGEQVGENVYTVARFVCNAPEQLHPSLSLSFFFFFISWILAAALVPFPCLSLPFGDVQQRALESAVFTFELAMKFVMHSWTADFISYAVSFLNCWNPLPFSYFCTRDSRWYVGRGSCMQLRRPAV